MSGVRRHLRVCVAIWALGQSALLTALLPRDCCASHPSTAHARSSAVSAEREAAPDDHCAMAAPQPAASAPVQNCTMRAECNGPLAALASLLSAQGIAPDVVTLPADELSTLVISSSSRSVVLSTILPDTPPPRA